MKVDRCGGGRVSGVFGWWRDKEGREKETVGAARGERQGLLTDLVDERVVVDELKS